MTSAKTENALSEKSAGLSRMPSSTAPSGLLPRGGDTRRRYHTFSLCPIPLYSGAGKQRQLLGCIGLLLNKTLQKKFKSTSEPFGTDGYFSERQRLAEERNRAAMTADREKLRSNLLRSISHDLRTPLTGIIGASAAIEENGDSIGAKETRKLAADIHEDAEWLLRMVENLLSVTRVSQVAELKKSEEAAEEVIVEAVSRCKKRFPDAQIRVDLPEDDMLFVPMDATLIVQVLINLMENAVRYAQTPIDIGPAPRWSMGGISSRSRILAPALQTTKKKICLIPYRLSRTAAAAVWASV